MNLSTICARVASFSLVLPILGCSPRDIVDNWPRFAVAGTVRNATGSPIAAAPVRVTIWGAPLTCADSVASTYDSTSTNGVGQYRAGLFFLTSSFTGCVRAETGTVHIDTLVTGVLPNAEVRLDVRVP